MPLVNTHEYNEDTRGMYESMINWPGQLLELLLMLMI